MNGFKAVLVSAVLVFALSLGTFPLKAQVGPVNASCSGTDTSAGGGATATLNYQYQVVGSGTWQHRLTGISVTNVFAYFGWSHQGNFTYPTGFPTYWTTGDDFYLSWFGGAQFGNIFGTNSAGAYFGVSNYGNCTVTLF